MQNRKTPQEYGATVLDAINIQINKAINRLQFDTTVEAEITAIINLETGQYQIKYGDGLFLAQARELTQNYNIGDRVYVLIRQNDLSNDRIITGPVEHNSLSSVEINKLRNQLVPVGPSLETFYKQEIRNAQIFGTSGEEYLFERMESENAIETADFLLQQYNDKEFLYISAEFLTTPSNLTGAVPTKGNYGLEFCFIVSSEKENETEEEIIRMDYNTFVGTPYYFSTWSPQDETFSVIKDSILGLRYVKLFAEGFDQPMDISVRNISVSFAEKKELIDNIYSVWCKTRFGQTFEAIDKLTLEPLLIYNSYNLIADGGTQVLWFKKNPFIMRDSEGYNEYMGVGWELISKENDSPILTVNKVDVNFINYYKFIVIYQDRVFFSEEIPVYRTLRNKNKYEIIKKDTAEGSFLSVEPELLGDWFKKLPDNTYQKINENLVNEIDISNMTQAFITYYFTSGNVILEYYYEQSSNGKDLDIVFSGRDNYKYDVKGDISIEEIEKTHILNYNILWAENKGAQYNVKFFIGEEEITTTSISPKYSMIKNISLDNEKNIQYNIKEKYDSSYLNNIIKIILTTSDQKVFTFEKEIIFIKEGEEGTNQTSYFAMIRPVDRYQAFGGINSTVSLAAHVYKDGVEVEEGLTYIWTTSNKMIELTTTSSKESTVKLVQDYDLENPQPLYVKVSITLKEENKEIKLFDFYPIDVLDNGAAASELNMAQVPQHIQYSTTGYNPTFSNIDVYAYYNNELLTPKSLTDKILTITTVEDKDKSIIYKLTPALSRVDTSQMGMLKFLDKDKKAIVYRTIILHLDTTGNEAIDGWDGTSLSVNTTTEQGTFGNDAEVFAPQVGAGTNSNGKFTGVVMGKGVATSADDYKYGLYGYQNGVATFGFKEDGTAFIGKYGAGQINFDGNGATIRGGLSGQKNSMILTLANSNGINGDLSAIEIYGNTKGQLQFSVDYSGKVIANNIELKNNVVADQFKIDYDEDGKGKVVGTIGGYEGNNQENILGIKSSTNNIAIEALGENHAIRLTATGGIVLEGNYLDCTKIPKDNQTGIYARFA